MSENSTLTYTPPRPFQKIPIINSSYQLYGLFHELLITFPKSQRYSLGATCQAEMLDLIKSCLRAAGTGDQTRKHSHLLDASSHLDTLRLLICLARDCRCLSNHAYQQCESHLSEIGRMLGGWLKSISSSP